MNTLAEQIDDIKIIYWPNPEFKKDGSVDIEKLKHFLIYSVPNTYFSEEKPNNWDPGKVFELQFRDPEIIGRIIVFNCILNLKESEESTSVVCLLCEPKNQTEVSAENITERRSEEIRQLIFGDEANGRPE